MVAVTVSALRRAVVTRGSAPALQPCPLCESPMELRRAGEDGRSGTWFWGCTRFPHCRGMISAPQPAPQPAGALPAPKRRRAPRRAKPRALRGLALTLLLITLLGIALLGSVPNLLGR